MVLMDTVHFTTNYFIQQGNATLLITVQTKLKKRKMKYLHNEKEKI